MVNLIPDTEPTGIEEQLKEKAQGRMKKTKKISKGEFIANLFMGKPGRDGDIVPFAPITEIEELAEKVQEAENKGYFKVRIDTKTERNNQKYISEVKWYLTQLAKAGQIDRKYNPRGTKKVEG